MSYVKRVLQPGEEVRHISSIYWIVYWPGVAVAVLAIAVFWFSDGRYLPRVWEYRHMPSRLSRSFFWSGNCFSG